MNGPKNLKKLLTQFFEEYHTLLVDLSLVIQKLPGGRRKDQ